MRPRHSQSILMAQAFPNLSFMGFDYHGPSVERARAGQHTKPGSKRGGCRLREGRRFQKLLFPAMISTWSLFSIACTTWAIRSARLNASPITRRGWHLADRRTLCQRRRRRQPQSSRADFYAASTMICVPASLSQDGGMALGAQAGKARLRQVVLAGGFTRFRLAAATPFNLVLEARP